MIGPRVRAAFVLAIVFALGFLAGMAFERHHFRPYRVSMSAAEEQQAAMAELRELLELDEEQVAQIHAVLADRQHIVQQAWEQLRPELQSEMRQVHVDIAELLRPEQRRRFHEWLIRRRAEHESESRTPHER